MTSANRKHPPTFRNTYLGDDNDFRCTTCGALTDADVHQSPTSILKRLRKLRCRNGHRWFPNLPASEFVSMLNICLRCSAKQHVLPWGECLTGHPMKQHYVVTTDHRLHTVPYGGCDGPR